MIAATGRERSALCLACFDGSYPVGLPEEEEVLGRHLLERALPGLAVTDVTGQGRIPAGRVPVRGSVDVDGVRVGLAGGAADALSRP